MSEPWQVEILNPSLAVDAERLEALRQRGVTVIDTLAAQRADLARSRRAGRPAEQEAPAEPSGGDEAMGERWVHRPWARQLVRTLPPAEHRALRLDRNRHRIRDDEQRRLAGACVAVCGLSVGQAIAVCLAQEGVGTSFRLADPDHLDLSNLNRLRASIADLGLPKVTLAARAMLDLDPYLAIAALPEGVRVEDPDTLLLREDGRPVDLLVEECDDLPLKIALRRRARQLRIPVLMATTEGGLLDVERFDLEPERPLFHGLCDGIDLDAILAGDDDARTAFVMAVLGRHVLSARTAADARARRRARALPRWPRAAALLARRDDARSRRPSLGQRPLSSPARAHAAPRRPPRLAARRARRARRRRRRRAAGRRRRAVHAVAPVALPAAHRARRPATTALRRRAPQGQRLAALTKGRPGHRLGGGAGRRKPGSASLSARRRRSRKNWRPEMRQAINGRASSRV